MYTIIQQHDYQLSAKGCWLLGSRGRGQHVPVHHERHQRCYEKQSDEFVSDDGESINLYSMIATCIAAIQKQQEEIDILKKRRTVKCK